MIPPPGGGGPKVYLGPIKTPLHALFTFYVEMFFALLTSTFVARKSPHPDFLSFLSLSASSSSTHCLAVSSSFFRSAWVSLRHLWMLRITTCGKFERRDLQGNANIEKQSKEEKKLSWLHRGRYISPFWMISCSVPPSCTLRTESFHLGRMILELGLSAIAFVLREATGVTAEEIQIFKGIVDLINLYFLSLPLSPVHEKSLKEVNGILCQNKSWFLGFSTWCMMTLILITLQHLSAEKNYLICFLSPTPGSVSVRHIDPPV